MFLNRSTICILIFLLVSISPQITQARKPHIINFRSQSLYPEAMVWEPSAQHFIVGSIRHRSIHSISDAGVVDTLISDFTLPTNTSIGGIALDRHHNRLLAVLHSFPPLPPFDALAAYDLSSRRRLFLSSLPATTPSTVANDVTVDFQGNAYVTNSAADIIWKVTMDGTPSVFSNSSVFTSFPVDTTSPHSDCGLNGIAYVSKGYLLVVQSNTGKMYKVDEEEGRAKIVLLNKDLTLADDIAIRSDGVVLVNSINKVWFLKSQDSWSEGVVFDETDLDAERFPTSVAVGAEDRAYVLYGNVWEGITGKDGANREWFEIEEVRSERESQEEKIWVYVLLGIGLAYFMFWRFQMKRLVENMNKKTN